MSENGDTFSDAASSEKLTAAERLKLAKKKRALQLKKYAQFEKQLEKECGKRTKRGANVPKSTARGAVRFGEHVVLLEAASRNDLEEVRSLLASGIDPNIGNDDGLTALHQCCIDNLEDMLRLLVQFGASVNACDSELWTPLHAAATCGHAQLCRYLVEQGADLLSVNGDGNMPYDICEHDSALEYIEGEMAKRGVTQDLINETRLIPEKKMIADLKQRLENETSLEFRGRNGETPLHIAATNGHLEAIRFLLDHKVSVSVTDDDLWQPIHCAAFWCQVPAIELLLQHGARLDVRTRSGESPFEICDDAETKKKMFELRKTFDSSGGRGFKSRALSRQRSSSFRRGSVRRSSMKEKKALSQKASREEGIWLHGAPMPNADDDDEVANTSTDKVPDNHSIRPNSTSSNITETSVSSTPGPTSPPDDVTTSPFRKSGLPGIRKGARSPPKDDWTELDQRSFGPLEDDLGKRSEITTLLIEDEEERKSEKFNGLTNGDDDREGVQFGPGGARSRKGCCGERCVLL